MSDENQEVEQITTPPTLAAPKSKKEAKPKDPKKVAAGKKLAEYNRKAKEALEQETKREEMERTAGEGASDAWIPEISFTTALTVAGVGLTLLDLLMRYRANAATGGPRTLCWASPEPQALGQRRGTEVLHAEASHAEGSPAEGLMHPKTGQPPKFGMD